MAGFTSDCRPAYRRARKRPFRMVATREYKVIGTRPIRPDGADKVTGRAEYGADIRLPGMLYGRVKRSPLPHGDIEAGFKEADAVIEREFETSMFHQGYIEPQNGTAYWNKDGQLTIWSSSQGHFMVRSSCANLLQLPISQVNAVPTEIGGGFGGKTLVYLEPVAALLSKKSGR